VLVLVVAVIAGVQSNARWSALSPVEGAVERGGDCDGCARTPGWGITGTGTTAGAGSGSDMCTGAGDSVAVRSSSAGPWPRFPPWAPRTARTRGTPTPRAPTLGPPLQDSHCSRVPSTPPPAAECGGGGNSSKGVQRRYSWEPGRLSPPQSLISRYCILLYRRAHLDPAQPPGCNGFAF